MPKNELDGLPFPPLVKVESSEPIKSDVLAEIIDQRPSGVSICVRSTEGHEERGGYFFHVRLKDATSNSYDIFNFEKISVLNLSLPHLTNFINHCAGLAFDEDSFQLCQTVVNFRLDPEPEPENEGA